MKSRLWIVVLGVVLGLACRWGFGDRDDAKPKGPPDTPNTSPDNGESTDDKPDNQATAYSDPLVPPISFLGPTSLSPKTDIASANGEHNVSVFPFLNAEFTHDERAMFEPHGQQVCASGCALSRHPTDKLTTATFRELCDQFAKQPIDETSEAYEALLFYGRQSRELLGREGVGPLDASRANALAKELTRTHARISIRVIDEAGVIRSSLPPTDVPLDRRHVFSMNVQDVQPLVTSGTVKRVGLYHLWTRL